MTLQTIRKRRAVEFGGVEKKEKSPYGTKLSVKT